MKTKQLNYLIYQILFTVTIITAFPQHQQRLVSSDEVFTAYSPGQYVLKQEPQVVKATPRLVATKNGQLVRTAGGTLKRVRVVPVSNIPASQPIVQPNQGLYAVEAPITLAQTIPASSTAKQPTIQYYPQAVQYIQQPLAQPQQNYYVQRAPQQTYVQPKAVAKPVAKPFRPQLLQNVEPEEEYPSDPNPQYNFSFDVKDDELTNYQNRQEERDGGVIKGSYSVVDPDGYVRTVTYTADSKNGFQAKVVREPTDVKVKIPIPTKAPEEEQQLFKKPVYRVAQYPQYAQQVYRQ